MKERSQASGGQRAVLYFARHPIISGILFSILLTAASLGFTQVQYGIANHTIHLPMLILLEQPQYFQSDYARSGFENFPTFFYQMLAILHLSEATKPVFFFIASIVLRFFCFFGIIKVADVLFKRTSVSCISALIFASGSRLWIGGPSVTGFLTYGLFVMPFLIFAIYLFLRKHIEVSFAVLGIMINFHGMHAGILALLLTFAAVLNLRTFGLKRIVSSLVLCAVLAGPMLLWRFNCEPPIIDFGGWLHVLEVRSGFEVFPEHWNPLWYIPAVLVLVCSVLCSPVVSMHSVSTTVSNTWHAVLFGTIGLIVIAVIGVEVVPLRRIIELQLWRSTFFLSIFAVPAIVFYLLHMLEKKDAAYCPAGMVIPLCLVSGIGMATLGLALVIPVLFLSYGYRLKGVRRLFCTIPVAAAAMVGLLPRLWPHLCPTLHIPFVMKSLKQSGDIVLAAVIVVLVLVPLFLKKRGTPARAMLVSATACFIAVGLNGAIIHGVHESQPAAWVDVQKWAHDNTPVDTVFLTPPYLSGFRVFSKRATTLEWKDGTMNFFDPQFGRQWLRRMELFGLDRIRARSGDGVAKAFRDLDERSLVNIARVLGADYIILKISHPLSLEREYVNEGFAVYRVPPRRVDENEIEHDVSGVTVHET